MREGVLFLVAILLWTARVFPQTPDRLTSGENEDSIQLLVQNRKVYTVHTKGQAISVQDIENLDSHTVLRLRSSRTLWAGYPLEEPTGAALSDEGTLFVVDQKVRTVFALRPDQKPEVVFSGEPLIRPTGIAINKDKIYITDPDAKGIFSLSLATHEIYEELHRSTAVFPEKIIWSNGKLYAYSRQSGSIIRLSSERRSTSELSDQNPAVAWSIPSSDPNGLKRGDIVSFKSQPWSDAIDFGVAREILYLLNPEGTEITMFPLLGGHVAVFKLPAAFGRATHLAVSASDLCIQTPTGIVSTGLVVPGTFDFEGGEISANLVSLYLYLSRNQLLPTKTVSLPEGSSLARLVTKKDGVLPSGYTEEFETVFCLLNQTLCKPRFAPVAIKAGTSLVLPDVAIRELPGRRIVDLPIQPDPSGDVRLQRHLNGTVGEVASEFVGRGVSKDELRQGLKSLNYWYTGKDILDEQKGTFIIPTESYQAIVALPVVDVLDKKSGLYKVLSKNVTLVSPVLYEGVQGKSSLAKRHSSQTTKPALGPPDDDPRCVKISNQDWNRLLEIIHYCLPVEAGPADIGIVEKHFDVTHPEFILPSGDSTLALYSKNTDTKPTGSDSQGIFDREWDHGTHVAALIGGHGKAHKVVGMHPNATLWGIKPGELDQVLKGDPSAKNLSHVQVINISLGEKDVNEYQNAGIGINSAEALKQSVEKSIYIDHLFIIAAGENHLETLESSLAGESTRQNVITVGASNLDPSPDFYSQSDYGWQYVDLVAPGENIESALFGGRYGQASGTSQATALVSGTAAILKSKQAAWEPWKVKQRILSTADLWTDTKNVSNVLTGMLNVKAAVLNEDKAVVRFWVPPQPGGGMAPNDKSDGCVGRIKYTQTQGQLWVAGTNITMEIPNIRRFWREGQKNTFTILYQTTTPPNTTLPVSFRRVLERATGVAGDDLKGTTEFAFFPMSEGCQGMTTIKLTNLSDLINGFYQ